MILCTSLEAAKMPPTKSVEILILRPPTDLQNGNLTTALQWQETLSGLGHNVRVAKEDDDLPLDLLILLHATKTRAAASQVRKRRPTVPTTVALTGTDLYPRLTDEALDSLQQADRIVVFQKGAFDRLPSELSARTHLIPLRVLTGSSSPPSYSPTDEFRVAVIGNLRAIKDPLRTAKASCLLPPHSRLKVHHIGALLEDEFAELVHAEEKENLRYRWHGPLPHEEVLTHLARAHLFVLTSEAEGGCHTLREAMGAGVPILSSRIDASVSLLGEDYPGLFPVGDTNHLASLLQRCEEDPPFRCDLKDRLQVCLAANSNAAQIQAWEQLLLECIPQSC